MDLQFVRKGVDFARKRKKWVCVLAAFGLTSYGVYRVYHLPSVAAKRRRLLKLFGVFVALAEAASESAETIGIVSKDLKEFLQSDSDQIPSSLRQISKITTSNEFSESLIRVTQAVSVGILKGYRSETRSDGRHESSINSDFTDRVMDKLFSTAGSGFASVVVGSFARSLVLAYYSGHEQSGGGSNSNHSSNMNHFGSQMNPVPEWVNVVCGDKCRELIGDCIQLFVCTAVAVYLDKTMDVNTYDELFSGLTNPNHEKKVRDVLVSVCNGAVETLVKTSHQVLTSPTLNENTSNVNSSSYLAIEEGITPTRMEDLRQEALSTGLEGTNDECEEKSDSGWVSKVSSTLAVPSNRRFVLDVTGRVTFETVRSFLEFLLEKLYEGVKRCVNIIHEAVLDKGLEVVRYATMKSSVVATICLSLCLHIFGGAWLLVPA
ncbi:hypothetical protein FNV43_RR17359 [Rhamnella rubrinervis]|uniref:Protein PHLOEM PROTEIN 2-LIKE A10 n=1 Tax=Rhamnella rubrinervis TaxID=2594499 RepID=A0A8K0E402_9ROSA|nr:hypothetical protein FNV43_RR17359 [Rhamnella rubrinervis]